MELTAREACRRRQPLGGTDAQALEHALTITERERDAARDALAALVKQIDVVHDDPDYQYAWSMVHMHAGPYKGAQYSEELAAAREVLEGKS